MNNNIREKREMEKVRKMIEKGKKNNSSKERSRRKD